MARTVGRLTLAEARLDFLRALLLNEYQGHAAFISELIGLIAYHERLLEALPRVINPPVGMSVDQPEDAWNALDAILARRPRLIHLHFYQDKVRNLCDSWGLRCAWAPAWVHSANLRWVNRGMSLQDFLIASRDWPSEVRGAILNEVERSHEQLLKGEADPPPGLDLVPDYFRDKDHLSLSEASERFDYLRGRDAGGDTEAKLRIEIEYDPLRDGEWSSIKRRVNEAARLQWGRNRRRILEESSTILEDTQPELRRHVHWLFLHICPQDDVGRPWGWLKIADAECLSATTIRDTVLALSRELGIALPVLRGGPPRQFP